jgi:hypothetical protein
MRACPVNLQMDGDALQDTCLPAHDNLTLKLQDEMMVLEDALFNNIV